MSTAFLHGNGGAASLNFKVVAYASEEEMSAVTPAENTIGVVTTTPISEYAFASEIPWSDPEEGAVFFKTADKSAVSFNALKKNTLTVYPIMCSQYISGEWIFKEAKIYKDRQWIRWEQYLWYYGDSCIASTGGWKTAAIDGSTAFATVNADGSKTLNGGSGISFATCTKESVDLTLYDTLMFDGSMTGSSASDGNKCAVYIWSKAPSSSYTENVQASLLTYKETIEGERILDISGLRGKYYVGYALSGNGTSITIRSIRLGAQ